MFNRQAPFASKNPPALAVGSMSKQTAEEILKYLKQNPERIPATEEFIEIYQDKTEPYQETTQICQENKDKKSFSKEDSLSRRIKFNQKIMRENKKIKTYEDLFLWFPIGSIVLFWADLFQGHEITTFYAVVDMLIFSNPRLKNRRIVSREIYKQSSAE